MSLGVEIRERALSTGRAGTRSRTACDLREGLAWRRKLLRSRSKPANRHVFCMAAEFVSRGGSGAFEVLSFGRRGYGMHLIAMRPWPIQFDLVRERQSLATPSRRHTTARPPRQRFLIGGCGCQQTAASGTKAVGLLSGDCPEEAVDQRACVEWQGSTHDGRSLGLLRSRKLTFAGFGPPTHSTTPISQA